MNRSAFDPQRLAPLVDALVAQGWFVGEALIDAELCQALFAEVSQLAELDALAAAGIGRGSEHHLRRDIRGDAIHWLDRESLAQRRYLAAMSELQQSLNQALYLGLFEFEAHFAHYPPGSFYKTHLDSFQGRANRVVSTVLYLNPGGLPTAAARWRSTPVGTRSEKSLGYARRPAPSLAFSPRRCPTRYWRPVCRGPASPAGSGATPHWAAGSTQQGKYWPQALST